MLTRSSFFECSLFKKRSTTTQGKAHFNTFVGSFQSIATHKHKTLIKASFCPTKKGFWSSFFKAFLNTIIFGKNKFSPNWLSHAKFEASRTRMQFRMRRANVGKKSNFLIWGEFKKKKFQLKNFFFEFFQPQTEGFSFWNEVLRIKEGFISFLAPHTQEMRSKAKRGLFSHQSPWRQRKSFITIGDFPIQKEKFSFFFLKWKKYSSTMTLVVT